ncbi:DNA polymerase III subunit chi [Klebsiella pneumoniae]|nr:DNA polymerase III subunit chi [Klebsiella pneumoniae]
MKNATFYLLDNDATVDGLSAVEQLVCDIAAERWRNGKRVLIACEDEQQAIRLDEALWSRPPESFVPHNLAGEGPRGGAPVEIAWPQKAQQQPAGYSYQPAAKLCRFCHRFRRSDRLCPLRRQSETTGARTL